MRATDKAEKTFLAMNTVVSHTAYGGRAGKALAAAQRETQRLEGLLSRFVQGSDVAKLNRAAGTGEVKLCPEAFETLAAACECSRNTEGCFDVTVGPLVRLWNASAEAPQQQAIDAARELTGYQTLRLTRRGRKACLPKAGQSVDLGGIGKGYAADRMTEIFRDYGVRSAFTDFGGNVAVLGAKPDGSPWKIGIRHPQRENSLIGALSVVGQSVVTSGDDQRAVVGADGKRRSHIIDPRTGMPAESGLLSVTVVSKSSMLADALATALFTAGMREGARFLKRYPGTHAVFIDRELSVFITGGLSNSFQAAQGIKTTELKGGLS